MQEQNNLHINQIKLHHLEICGTYNFQLIFYIVKYFHFLILYLFYSRKLLGGGVIKQIKDVLAPSDIVVQGHFQVVSVILAPYKINLCSY